MSSWRDKEGKKRKVSSSVTDHDVATLRKHYTFLPQAEQQQKSWQGRMVLQYHSHLYKDCVLANMTRVSQQQLGLRWRTAAEVRAGRGSETCGNLHCPSLDMTATSNHPNRSATTGDAQTTRIVQAYLKGKCGKREQEEKSRVVKLPYGILLTAFEVPFTYKEHEERKTELVALRLCVRCAPLLFQSKGEEHPYRAACRARLAAYDRADLYEAAASGVDDNPKSDDDAKQSIDQYREHLPEKFKVGEEIRPDISGDEKIP